MKVTIHVEVASVSVTTEPGVVSIFPMRDKKNPIGLLVKLKQLGVLCRHGGGGLRIALHRLGDEADFAFLLGRIERRGVERAEGADRLRVVHLLRLLEPEPRRRQGIQSRESSRPTGRTLRTTGHSGAPQLAAILSFEKDLEVVGEAEDGLKAVHLARRLKPDIVIMDLLMPVLDGVGATLRIAAEAPATKVLILTSYGSALEIRKALDAGARGAIMKSESDDVLLKAIRTIAAGERFVARDIEQTLSADEGVQLSDRQRELLASITRGLSNDDIAQLLGISTSAVKQRLTVLLAKLGAANRTEAAAIALKKQLLKL